MKPTEVEGTKGTEFKSAEVRLAGTREVGVEKTNGEQASGVTPFQGAVRYIFKARGRTLPSQSGKLLFILHIRRRARSIMSHCVCTIRAVP